MRLVERMLLELNAAFDGEAWYGTPLRRLLDGIDDPTAHRRAIPSAHTIAELLAHVSAWMEIVAMRLGGIAFDPSVAEDYPSVEGVPLSQAIGRLERAHTKLVDTVARMTDADFDRMIAGKNYTADFMLHGVVQHNAYHAGQIALLKKT
jgi:uncharacterized damage-inducible protein DinB